MNKSMDGTHSMRRSWLMLAVYMAVVAIPVVAQPQGASLGGNASDPIEAFQTACDIGVWVAIGLGIIGCIWGAVNVMTEHKFSKQFMGAGICFGLSGVIALIDAVVNNSAPSLPTW